MGIYTHPTWLPLLVQLREWFSIVVLVERASPWRQASTVQVLWAPVIMGNLGIRVRVGACVPRAATTSILNMSVSSDRLLTLSDLVNICDNVHIRRPSPTPHEFDAELLIPLCLSATPSSPVIGLLRPILIDQLIKENQTSAQLNKPPLWDIRVDPEDLLKPFVHRTDGGTGALTPSVSFQPWLDTHAKRTAAIKELCERWRDTGVFPEVCGPKKWRSELYPVYKDPFGPHDHPSRIPSDEEVEKSNFAFEMERAACALFGVVTYGVHLSIYDVVHEEGKAETLRLWVPTRAKTKQTYLLLHALCVIVVTLCSLVGQDISITLWQGGSPAEWASLSRLSRSRWKKQALQKTLSGSMLALSDLSVTSSGESLLFL